MERFLSAFNEPLSSNLFQSSSKWRKVRFISPIKTEESDSAPVKVILLASSSNCKDVKLLRWLNADESDSAALSPT